MESILTGSIAVRLRRAVRIGICSTVMTAAALLGCGDTDRMAASGFPSADGGTSSASLGDPCQCDGVMCVGRDTGCGEHLVCVGSPAAASQRCSQPCTEAPCPLPFVCTTLVVDSVDIGEWCDR